mmetsp:Transcript_114894/g.287094  ORF Transcript_114894/g.287094 Transcript_114894/m.287094 type:complete len:228 (+) Transcript_114894:117-800(+)
MPELPRSTCLPASALGLLLALLSRTPPVVLTTSATPRAQPLCSDGCDNTGASGGSGDVAYGGEAASLLQVVASPQAIVEEASAIAGRQHLELLRERHPGLARQLGPRELPGSLMSLLTPLSSRVLDDTCASGNFSGWHEMAKFGDVSKGDCVRVVANATELQRLSERPAPGAESQVYWVEGMEQFAGQVCTVYASWSEVQGYFVDFAGSPHGIQVFPFDALLLPSVS